MKKYLKAIIFIIVFITILYFMDQLYNPVGTQREWYQSNGVLDFYKQNKDTIDILYVGDSSVYSGISPMEVYNQIGVTGFSFSSPGQKVWSSYYFIKEAYKTQKPKIVFLETGEFFAKKENEDELSRRRAIDSLKLSANKMEMINDDTYNFSNYDKLGCIFPTLRYHSRWSKIDEMDIRKLISNTEYTYKGYLLDKSINEFSDKKSNNKKRIKSDKKESKNIKELEAVFPEEVKEKLNKIEDICKNNNSELVFISMPSPKTWTIDQYNKILEYATYKNIKFIDLNIDEKIQMDWKEDSSDAGNHLNIYGAEKVGKYIADYIKTNWNMEEHKTDEKYTSWNEELEGYKQNKLEKLNKN